MYTSFLQTIVIIILYFSNQLHSQTWIQVGEDIDGEAKYDYTRNISLNFDGSIIAIGAPGNSGNGTLAGNVRIFMNYNGIWTQIGDDIDGEAERDDSGTSVSLSSSGLIVAIGAPSNDGNGDNSGHVRVFQNYYGSWIQLGNDINGESAGDHFGYSVDLSSDGLTVAIGAIYKSVNGFGSGHVRIFEYRSGSWYKKGNNINGDSPMNLLGFSVSLSSDGSVVAVGAPGTLGPSGYVRVFKYSGGEWTKIGDDIYGENAEDKFGWSVSLSSDGTKVAIGAPENDINSNEAGYVRVYESLSGTWVQIGNEIKGEEAKDYCGCSVSLNSEGSIMAVGSRNSSKFGSVSGHVRIFKNNEETWEQVGEDIGGEAVGDRFGWRVRLSDDGSVLAVSAPYNDGNGWDAGHVRVFSNNDLKEIDEETPEIYLYPNPTYGFVSVVFKDIGAYYVTINDICGKLLMTQEMKLKTNIINLSAYRSGIYFINIHTDKGVFTSKIIKR